MNEYSPAEYFIVIIVVVVVDVPVSVLSGTAVQRAPSVPSVRPGVETEQERSRARQQHAVYRRLFMDIEREQVKENVRQRSHRQRMAAYVATTTLFRVPPGPSKSLKVPKFHTFKYKALKSP